MTHKLLGLCIVIVALGTGVPHPARAQSLDDLELRKQRQKSRLGFGMLALMETATGLNGDRPEVNTLLYLAPQMKIGDTMRLRLNFQFAASWLERQENPWDFPDLSIQFSHLGLYKESWSGILLSGFVRYYLPTSKASRNAGSYGQLRLVGKLSRSIGPVFLAFELNGQKYFAEYTTWDTGEEPGSEDWYRTAGREDYVANNASFGFGETLTLSVSALRGLDLSAIYGLYQSRQYQPDEGHGDRYGSSYLQQPRDTEWIHAFRLILDVTYNLGALPWVRSGRWEGILSRTYLSLGYACTAPQVQEEGVNMNPFNPRFASAYLDLMVLY